MNNENKRSILISMLAFMLIDTRGQLLSSALLVALVVGVASSSSQISKGDIVGYIREVEVSSSPLDDEMLRSFLVAHPEPTAREFGELKTRIADSLVHERIAKFKAGGQRQR